MLPAYGGASIDSLAPALLAPGGQRPEWLPAPARDAAQVVLLVLDGLGWLQLCERPEVAPFLSSLVGGPITSVVPTTTATALTSIALGTPPAGHGVVGYRLRVEGPEGDEVLNVLRWRTSRGDARESVPPLQFQPCPAFAGRDVPVVTRGEFLSTGFTIAHQSGTRQFGYALASSMVVEVGRLIGEGEPFVYAYYDGVDKIAHIHGFGPYFDAELRAADRLAADIAAALAPGAVLVVTADHGEVHVGAAVRPLGDDVLAETALVSGEGRFRWLHARAGREAALAATARARHGHEAWVWTTAELEQEGLFGGPLSPAVRGRLGDVALVPWAPISFGDPADTAEIHLVCRHGSLTAAEMLVPLLATAGRHGEG